MYYKNRYNVLYDIERRTHTLKHKKINILHKQNCQLLYIMTQSIYYPIKNYRGKRWAHVHLIRGAANHPIIVHYEACKFAYLCILISEASTRKKYKEIMPIEARKTIFFNYFNGENSQYVRPIRILSPCKSDVRRIGLISPCRSDNCRYAKSLIIFTRRIW